MTGWPTTAVLHVETDRPTGITVWAIVATFDTGTDIVADGFVDRDGHLVTDTTSAVAALAARTPDGLHILVQRPSLLAAIRERDPIPGVVWDGDPFHFGPEIHAGRAYAKTALPAAVAVAQPGPPPRLTIAVDGSFGRATRTGGWAYVTQNWQYATGATGSIDSSNVAELKAIHLAVSAYPQKQPLHIVSDSQVAISIAEGVRRSSRRDAKQVRLILQDRDVTFEWVRGHTGNIMNETADRLAVAARRTVEWNTDPALLDATCATIISDGQLVAATPPAASA